VSVKIIVGKINFNKEGKNEKNETYWRFQMCLASQVPIHPHDRFGVGVGVWQWWQLIHE
jgi:hypothetical protein